MNGTPSTNSNFTSNTWACKKRKPKRQNDKNCSVKNFQGSKENSKTNRSNKKKKCWSFIGSSEKRKSELRRSNRPSAKSDGKRFKKYNSGASSKLKRGRAKKPHWRLKTPKQPSLNLKTWLRKRTPKSLKVSRRGNMSATCSNKPKQWCPKWDLQKRKKRMRSSFVKKKLLLRSRTGPMCLSRDVLMIRWPAGKNCQNLPKFTEKR